MGCGGDWFPPAPVPRLSQCDVKCCLPLFLVCPQCREGLGDYGKRRVLDPHSTSRRQMEQLSVWVPTSRGGVGNNSYLSGKFCEVVCVKKPQGTQHGKGFWILPPPQPHLFLEKERCVHFPDRKIGTGVLLRPKARVSAGNTGELEVWAPVLLLPPSFLFGLL